MLNAMLSKKKLLWLRISVLCLALGCMMQTGCIPIVKVSAAEGVIFDLNISAYDANSAESSKGIVDGATDSTTETITVTGTPTLKTIEKRGTKYLTFNGDDGRDDAVKVEDSDVAGLSYNQDLSIEMWAKDDGTRRNGEHFFIVKNSSGANVLQPYYTSNNLYMKIDNSDSYRASFTPTEDNEWSHYVFTREYNSTESKYTWRMYVNGAAKGSAVTNNLTTNIPAVLHIGTSSASSYGAFVGDIGAFRVYNYALDATEISANYSAEGGNYIVQALNLSSVNPADGSDIIPEEGTITLTFDKDIDPATIGGISLQTESGTVVENQSVDMSTTSTKKVVVSYSGLSDEAPYKLVIPDTLSSTSETGSIKYDGSELSYETIAFLPVVEGDLLFEMNIDAYDVASVDGAKGITNAVTGNATEQITVSGTPAKKTVEGAETSYLEFRNGAEGADRGISILDPVINRSKALSVEGWIRDRSGQSGGYMLVHSNGSSNEMEIKNYDASSISYLPNVGASANTVANAAVRNQWAHYVFTRSFNETGCDWSVYINGELKSSGTIADASMADPVALMDYVMYIGGGSYSNTDGFEGDIAKLRIWQKALTVQEVVAAYDENSLDFVSKTIRFESATPGGGSISPLPSSIKLTFDNFVDAESLSAIKFTKSDDTAVSGKVYIELAAERSKEVIITYGTLEPLTSYKISISTDLKSIYGVALTEIPEPIIFTTTQAESNTFLDADFEGENFVVGQQPPAIANLTYISSGTADDTSNFEVRETTDGDKYIVFDVSYRETLISSQLVYTLPKTITTESVAFEIGIRPMSTADSGTGTAVRDFFRAYNSAGKYTNLGAMTSGTLNSAGNDVNKTSFAAETENDGFYHVKVVLEKGEGNTYHFNLYPNYKTDPKAYVTLEFTNVSFTDISKVMLAHIYPQKAEHYDSAAVAISYIKGYYYNQPTFLGTDAEDLTTAAKEIKLYFDRDINAASLETATFTLTETKSEKTFPLQLAQYDSNERCAVLKLPVYLKPGAAYSISAKDAMSAENIPISEKSEIAFTAPMRETSVSSATFADGDGKTVTDMSTLTGEKELSVSFALKNKAGGTQSCILLAQVYDKNDRLIYVTSLPVSLTTSAPTETLTVSYPKGFKQGDYVKVGVWNMTGGYAYSLMAEPCMIK